MNLADRTYLTTAEAANANRSASTFLRHPQALPSAELHAVANGLAAGAPSLPQPPEPEAGWPGHVYFVRAGQERVVKIGFTTSEPGVRMAGLQTSHHQELSLVYAQPGSVRLEQWFHAAFARLRLRGEWFRYTCELRFYLFVRTGR